ncbi:MAG: helical backbone metal receptor [Gemmatimonadales bacterium]
MTRVRAFLLFISITACGPAAVRDGPLVILDDMGRTVTFAAPAQRVVSLLPAFTEMLFAIGAGDRVVGRSRFDEDPAEALQVPSVGDGLGPNVEAVLARTPDLVLIYRATANNEAVAQLERLGVSVIALRTDLLNDVPRTARLLGRLTGTADSAEVLARVFENALDSAREVPVMVDAPSALILAWDQPPIVIGSGSFQSELVQLAGLRNAFAEVGQPSAQVSLEMIVASDPDVILTTSTDSIPAWARRPEWRAVRAVREGRFVRFDGTAFGHPSFRALHAVRLLQARVAP